MDEATIVEPRLVRAAARAGRIAALREIADELNARADVLEAMEGTSHE